MPPSMPMQNNAVQGPRVALIGYGAIGRQVLASMPDWASLSDSALAVLLRPGSKGLADLPGDVHACTDIASLLAWRPDLVVEAAGQQAVRDHVTPCLEAGVPVILGSSGALADAELATKLLAAAEKGRTHVTIASGAIAALDYVRACKHLPGTQVTYESRKPVAAWISEIKELGMDPDSLAEPLQLFSGPAAEAALRYPKNLNVAATLALAGVGMEETRVVVMADPHVQDNQHLVRVDGPAGSLELKLVNAPSPANPKTSHVVAFSLLDAMARHFSVLRVG